MLISPPVDARLAEIGWIPDYLDDLDADFRVFYGEPDMMTLPGARFFVLAERVFAYGGVMSARADALRAAQEQQATTPTAPDRARALAPAGGRTAAPDVTALARDSRFAGIFSTAKVARHA